MEVDAKLQRKRLQGKRVHYGKGTWNASDQAEDHEEVVCAELTQDVDSRVESGITRAI